VGLVELEPFTHREVVRYLLHRGLISSLSIVKGDVEVADASQRNCNFRVTLRESPSYLLKQGIDAERIATIEHEAKLYAWFESDKSADSVVRYLPRFYGYDSERHLLILELLKDALDLQRFFSRRRHLPRQWADALGDALGTFHRLREGPWRGSRKGPFVQETPWALSFHKPLTSIFREVSSANVQVFTILQQDREWCDLLDDLGRDWTAGAFIHFDVRWSNCLLCTLLDEPGKQQIKLIDWEMAGSGDPCWDAAAVLNEYLSWWLRWIPIISTRDLTRLHGSARDALITIQHSLNAFWRAYARRMEVEAASREEWLVRIVKYCAARLLQTAYEQMQSSIKLTPSAVCLLQLSRNILKSPGDALSNLCGISIAS